jgi:hypothetical protein
VPSNAGSSFLATAREVLHEQLERVVREVREAAAADFAGDPFPLGRAAPPSPPSDVAPLSPTSMHAEEHGAVESTFALTAHAYTQCANLLVLMPIALELSLPEALWCVGESEGRVIASMCAGLVGPDMRDDAQLLGLAGGLRVGLTAIEDWKREELVQKLERALRALCQARGLSENDVLRSAARFTTSMEPTMPASDAATRRCLAAMLGACLAVVQQRAELGGDELLPLLASGTGVIERSATRVVVRRPMAEVDLRLRRAALDGSPGFLPWLEQHWSVEFEPGEGEEL